MHCQGQNHGPIATLLAKMRRRFPWLRAERSQPHVSPSSTRTAREKECNCHQGASRLALKLPTSILFWCAFSEFAKETAGAAPAMTCCRAVAAGLFSPRATPLRVHLSATRHGGLQGRRVPCVVCGALAKEAPYIKVCGVMSAADAQHAAEAGANLIGMIMFPRAKRALTVEQAKRVAEAARAHGAEPVGVFVDEDAETIVRCAGASGRQVEDLWCLRVLHSPCRSSGSCWSRLDHNVHPTTYSTVSGQQGRRISRLCSCMVRPRKPRWRASQPTSASCLS